ncbi:MAG: ferredoxin [Candidatus Thermoplasmatota archaeon]|jgi:ferredoxin|nr:ferredoxin [Candidatus Thermoplasmatota archaeon]
MKVLLDRERCLGESVCTAVAPSYFRMGRDGKADLIRDATDDATLEEAREAASLCPALIISLKEVH